MVSLSSFQTCTCRLLQNFIFSLREFQDALKFPSESGLRSQSHRFPIKSLFLLTEAVKAKSYSSKLIPAKVGTFISGRDWFSILFIYSFASAQLFLVVLNWFELIALRANSLGKALHNSPSFSSKTLISVLE